jgi:hypothetical protein
MGAGPRTRCWRFSRLRSPAESGLYLISFKRTLFFLISLLFKHERTQARGMHLSGQAHMLLNRVISINLGFLASGNNGSSPATTECAQEV